MMNDILEMISVIVFSYRILRFVAGTIMEKITEKKLREQAKKDWEEIQKNLIWEG